MKKAHTPLFALPLLFAAIPLQASSLYTQNFDALSLGALPTGPNVFTAQIAPANTSATVIDFNGGKALRFVDSSTTGRPVAEHNFVANAESNITTARFDFSVRLNDFLAADSTVFQIGLGSFNTNTGGYFFSTTSARTVDFRLTRGGRLIAGGQTSASSLDYGDSGVNFSIFANAGSTAVDYTGPDGVVRSLANGKYSVFANESLVSLTISSVPTTQFNFANANTTGFGRFSFGTGTSNANISLDFTVDNIAVSDFSAIPEPSAFAVLAGFAAFGVVGLRRRR
ncbi:MAG: hypothetical protein MUE42_00625 [Opitutaceae bacterium]|jgi:hypothetical protein|nr:hypothetical protein [Opitutaceae bacterium]